jgi:TatD DNase family protein
MIADAHCHLEGIPGWKTPDNMVVFTSGYSHESNLANARIAKEVPRAHCILGIAPQTAMRFPDIERKLPAWKDFIRSQNPVAIGEIGLDFHYAKEEHEQEREYTCFKHMISLAKEMKLPIVIHSRDAEEEVLAFLESEWDGEFLMHCFAGTKEQAEKAVELGGSVSIPPIRSKERKKVIKALTMEKLLAETDAPYIGKKPEDVAVSIGMIAEIKGIPPEEAEKATFANAMRFFRVKV